MVEQFKWTICNGFQIKYGEEEEEEDDKTKEEENEKKNNE